MPRVFRIAICPGCGEKTSTPDPRIRCAGCGQFFDVREQNVKDDRDYHDSRRIEFLGDPYPEKWGADGVTKLDEGETTNDSERSPD